MQLPHIFVTPGLGQDTGRSDRGEEAVSFDDAPVRDASVLSEPVTVDQQQPGPDAQLVEGQVHGLERCLKDIDPVDLVVVDAGYGV